MQSSFSGIEIGKRGLLAHNRALTTVGHNVTNASTEGYSRQRVEMSTFNPLTRPGLTRPERAGQLGQGVEVSRIERVRDLILEDRIAGQASNETYWEERDEYVLKLEQIYNEPGEESVRGSLDEFWDSWQELSLHPEQQSAREAVLERGETLVDNINQRYNDLDRIRSMLEDEIQGAVSEVNDLANEIAGLNREIRSAEAAGDDPNDLYDRRDLLVERLGKHVDISTDRRDPDEFRVNVGGFHLVQGTIAQQFATEGDENNDGYSKVVWEHSGEEAQFRSGRLAAFLELRDEDVRGEIQTLDNMAVNFTDLVNEIHRDGYGSNGRTGRDFFTELPAVENTLGNLDSDGDGQLDSSRIFRLSGANEVNANEQIGLEGNITLSGPDGPVEVAYNPTDTVEQVLTRINNSGAEVTARINRNDQITLKGTPAADKENPDFVIREVTDSGEFLADYAGLLSASGEEGSFRSDSADAVVGLQEGADFSVAPQRNPSAWLGINPEIQQEPATIAAGLSRQGNEGEVGDGGAAEAIAQLRSEPVNVGQISTFDDYFADATASIGLRGEQARNQLETAELEMKELRDWRDSISGVNIDEELSQMIKFQHGYNAAARFVTQVDRMLDTIINGMGV
ncbi:MAG: flagellar hook-associated protein FlgK [Spirochaetota bacterium]